MSNIELYKEMILKNSQSPLNKNKILNCTHTSKGNNPLCGDSVELFANIKDKKIFTPELSSNILPGITRHQVIKIIKDKKLDFEEGSYSIDDLKEASSIWFTSTTKGIIGVEEIVNLQT